MRGRPLRFLAVVIAGWSAARALILWPSGPAGLAVLPVPDRPIARGTTVVAASIDQSPPVSVALRTQGAPRMASTGWPLRRVIASPTGAGSEGITAPSAARGQGRKPGDPDLILLAAMAFPGASRISLTPVATPGFPAATAPERRSRWSGSAWLIAREGGATGVSSPLLGGAQAGIRLTRTLDAQGATAAFVRADTPLGPGSGTLGAGLQWRAGKLPVTVLAEVRRDGAGVAPAVGAFGGGTAALPGDFRLSGYGQAGVIGRGRGVGYADGQAQLLHPLGAGRVEGGLGAWGAAQPGAARLDIGPTLAVPIATGRAAFRLSLDWRHRIVGNARPGTGAVLSVGTDF